MAATPVADPSVLTNAQTPQTLQAWTNLLDSVFGGGTTTTNTSGDETSTQTSETDSAANDPIRALLALLIPGASGGMNNPQSQQLIAGLLQQFKEGAGGLSGIAAAGNSAGVYNSSTQGLLANDAMARAVAAAAGTIGTQQNQQQQIIAQLLATLSAGSRRTTQTGTRNTNQTQQQSRSGSPAAQNAMRAAAAAGAAKAAAKGISNLFSNKASIKPGGGPEEDNEAMARLAGGLEGNKGDQAGDYPQHGVTGGNVMEFSGDPADPFGIGGYDPEWGNYGTGGLDAMIMDFSGDTNDPFGLGGYDIGDYSGGDAGGGMDFSFLDGFSGIDFGDSGSSDDGSGGYGGDFEFSSGDF